MLLSETDAKTKQCRVMPPVQPNTTNTLGPISAWPMSCAASGCMHWRWGEPTYEYGTGYHDQKPSGEGWEWKYRNPSSESQCWRRIVEPRGYCGLAGRP